MTTSFRAKSLILLAMLLISVPAGAGQLVSASLKNGDYGTGPAGPGTAVAPTSGIVNTADGVLFIATEASGRSNGLVNWQIGNNFQWRRTGTITFLFKATRGQLTSGQIVCDNRGFGTFRNGQATFSVDAVPAANGPGEEDDRVTIAWRTWHNNVWYGHATTQIEYDRWYSLGFAWGGPSEFELWVDQELTSAVNLPAANFPWGTDAGQNGFNMGLGDNHERGVDGYNSAAGVSFADVRMWNEYRALGDTVDPGHPPTTADDAYTINEDVALVQPAPGVLANDSDQDGDALTAAVSATPLNGTLDLQPDGSFSYQPNAGFHGTDTFTYIASDGAKESTGTVTITIDSVNDAPVAVDDAVTTSEDIAVTIDVLANDTDADQDALQITSAAASVGSAQFQGSAIVFTPPPDYFGSAAIEYSISDGQGGTADATVTVAISPVNDPPATADVSATTPAGTPVTVTLGGSDIDSAALTFVPGEITGGTVSGVSPTFTFTPAPGFSGQGGFSFVVLDGDGGSASGQVTITVTAPPPPALSFDSIANAIRALAGLNHGQRTSLLARLTNAQRAYENGHTAVAIRDLLQVADSLARFSQSAEATQTVSDIRALAASLQ